MEKTGRPVVLITGASSGIGLEMAGILAADGRELVLTARSEKRLEETAYRLASERSVPVHVRAADLSEPGGAERLYRSLESDGISVGALVNNAGFGTWGPFRETPASESLAMMRLNMEAVVHLTALCLPSMLDAGSGKILNVASTAAFQPGPLMAIYYATKAFVLHFSEALARELEGTGVTVTAFCPGPVRTGFGERAGIGRIGGLARMIRPMSAEEAARAGLVAMERGKPLVIPGLVNRMTALSAKLMPRRLTTRLVHRVQAERGGP